MKKLGVCSSIFIVLIVLTGCTNKEFQTNRYFEAYTKDDILEAGKLAFRVDPLQEYVVDSYRNKLEATRIGLIFNTLQHQDFVFNVTEDECGTKAILSIVGSFGVNKILKHDMLESEHQLFWDKVDFFLARKDDLIIHTNYISKDANSYDSFLKGLNAIKVKRRVTPKKDLTHCVIKMEFENGVIKQSQSTMGGMNNENL